MGDCRNAVADGRRSRPRRRAHDGGGSVPPRRYLRAPQWLCHSARACAAQRGKCAHARQTPGQPKPSRPPLACRRRLTSSPRVQRGRCAKGAQTRLAAEPRRGSGLPVRRAGAERCVTHALLSAPASTTQRAWPCAGRMSRTPDGGRTQVACGGLGCPDSAPLESSSVVRGRGRTAPQPAAARAAETHSRWHHADGGQPSAAETTTPPCRSAVGGAAARSRAHARRRCCGLRRACVRGVRRRAGSNLQPENSRLRQNPN
jgi:hypothetical protein